MSSTGQEQPFDVTAETFLLEQRIKAIQFALSGQVARLQETGATPNELDEMNGVRQQLSSIGALTIGIASSIDMDAIPEKEWIYEPDETLTEDDLFGMTLRFAERKVGETFTLDDLETRLRRNGAILPENPRERQLLLTAWLDEVSAILNEQGDTIHLMRTERDGVLEIAFARVVNKKPVRTNQVDPLPAVGKPPIAEKHKSTTVAPESPTKHETAETRIAQHVLDTALDMVRANPDRRVAHHINELERFLSGNSPFSAKQIYDALLAQGSIFKAGGAKGKRIFTETRPTPRRAKQSAGPEQEATSAIDTAKADALLQVLANEPDISKYLSTAQIVRGVSALNLPVDEFEKDDAKRVGRALSRLEIAVFTRGKLGSAEVQKFGFASQQIKEMYKTPQGRSYILSLIENGETFIND